MTASKRKGGKLGCISPAVWFLLVISHNPPPPYTHKKKRDHVLLKMKGTLVTTFHNIERIIQCLTMTSLHKVVYPKYKKNWEGHRKFSSGQLLPV